MSCWGTLQITLHMYFTPRSPLNAATNTWWVWRVESRQTENEGGIRVV